MDKQLVLGISLYRSSTYRQKILRCVGNGTMTPSEISKNTGIRLNHVSMFLMGMKQSGLVTCLNEKNKRGRLYELTEIGKKVVSYENGSSG